MPDSNVRWLVNQRSPLPYSSYFFRTSDHVPRMYSFEDNWSNICAVPGTSEIYHPTSLRAIPIDHGSRSFVTPAVSAAGISTGHCRAEPCATDIRASRSRPKGDQRILIVGRMYPELIV